jgi:hypothetical protein
LQPSPDPDPLMKVARVGFSLIRLVQWFIGAGFILTLGIHLLCSPSVRANPRELTLSDAIPGILAIVVALVMIALAIYMLLRSMR